MFRGAGAELAMEQGRGVAARPVKFIDSETDGEKEPAQGAAMGGEGEGMEGMTSRGDIGTAAYEFDEQFT
jgi:hypothetical protein